MGHTVNALKPLGNIFFISRQQGPVMFLQKILLLTATLMLSSAGHSESGPLLDTDNLPDNTASAEDAKVTLAEPRQWQREPHDQA